MKVFYLNSKLVLKFATFFSLYRSPSQTADNFDSFLDNLRLNLDALTDNNPFLAVALRDFNARSSSWRINVKTNDEGTNIDCLANEYDLKQVINPIQDGGRQKGPPTSFSTITSTNVEFGPQNLLTFSFNLFATLVKNFKFLPSASPKLLNLNQDHPSRKAIFLNKSL